MQQARIAFFGGGLPGPEPEPDAASPDELRQLREREAALIRRELEGRVNGRSLFQPDPAHSAELRAARADRIIAECGRKGTLPPYTSSFTREDMLAARIRRYGK